MRSEISAMANKIWPNGDNKVPDKYKQAIQQSLGWDVDSVYAGGIFPGKTFMMQGIWYDLGNIGAGFDNDGDLVPDRNAWMQPVGDPTYFNPDCYRLIGVFGLVIVKLNDGTEYLIPFEDQLYFEHIPENNTGAVGLVFYRFAVVGGPCSGGLSPYQEVASGYNNEKFNGDYGRSISIPLTTSSVVTFSKTVDKTKLTGAAMDTLSYTLSLQNTGPEAVGNPSFGIPLVIEDKVPAGTAYIAGTAAANNSLPSGVSGYAILYSTDNGASWTVMEPPAASVTNIRWQLNSPLPAGATGIVTFKVKVTLSSAPVLICNEAALKLGTSAPFATAQACTLGLGINTTGDLVWRDDGGTTGTAGNGIKDGDEAGIPNITVSLYYDLNGDGKHDSGDILWGTKTTNASGAYLFDQLPDGKWVVVVCDACVKDTPTYTGWGNTTSKFYPVNLDPTSASGTPVNVLTSDFGYAPALRIKKNLNTGTPDYEGQEVTFTIKADNMLPPPTNSQCLQTAWATGIASSSFCNNPTNATGAPNGVYAVGTKWNNFTLAGNGFTFPNPTGSIAKVELLFYFYHSQPIINETMFAEFPLAAGGTYTTQSLTVNEINQYVGLSNAHLVVFDVTNAQAWNWSHFSGAWNSKLKLVKTTSGDGSTPYVDAIGVRVTPSSCSESLAFDPNITLTPVPLTDTYDPARLQYVSASPPPDNVNTGTGVITWNNIGPINGQDSKYVTVVFKAKEPSNLLTGDTTTNVANVTNAFFANGSPANSGTSAAGVRILRSGSIAGVLWSDTNANGWQTPNGWQTGEPRIPDAKVVLHTCTAVAPNGTCGGILVSDTIRTDANGAYLFEGLQPGLYYKIDVLTSTIPGTPTQTGDPDDDPVNGSGNGGTCGSGGGNAACDNAWDRNKLWFRVGTDTWAGQSWDVTNINFGYSVQAALFGNVWRDYDGNGIRSLGEPGISGVVVERRNGVCTPGVNCPTATTDIYGNYTFSNVTPGNYTLVVLTNTLPIGSTWTETAESDGTINNQIPVTLATGVVSGSHNFGWQASGTASIGDLLYYDWDGDGVKDANEEGIPNITMNLYLDVNANGEYDDGTDMFRASTVTNANGGYLFSNLPPGNYVVWVDENDPDFPKSYNQTADPNYAGIPCVTCDGTGNATLTTGAVLTMDFGYKPTGVGIIGDQVWYDANGNGVKAGLLETGIPNITVQLWVDFNNDNSYVLLTTTAANSSGAYSFTNLPDGKYRVVVDSTDADMPKDAVGSRYSPTTSTTYDVVMNGGKAISLNGSACSNCDLNADFGFTKLGVVGDFLFWDANKNGQQDWTETGIPNVTVELYNSSNVLVATTVTSDGSGGKPVGFYSFGGLLPGEYYIIVDSLDVDLGGATLIADPSADGLPCSDPSAVGCDHRFDFSVTYGTVFAGVDFGYQPKGIIGDFVWLDSDNDGVQDAGEPGIFNVPVKITNQTPVTIDGINYAAGAYSDTVFTDFDGYYTFSTLPNGTWTVQVLPGANYTPTYDADGGLNNLTSVVISNGGVSNTGNAWCAGSDCSLQVDFGLKLNGNLTLSGTVCIDDGSSDGVCSTGGETKLEGLIVRIYSGSGAYLGSTLTDAVGNYSFPGLPAGTYSVVISTTQSPLDLTTLTTTADDTPATTITTNPASIVQSVPVSANTTGVDFAFQFSVSIDFGDLPAYYPVRLSDGPVGAYHILPTTPNLYLGASVDAEPTGTYSPGADADDNNGDDENGITFNSPTSWINGINGGSFTAVVNGTGWLAGWIDFERDSSFAQASNLIVNQAVTTGAYNISFDIPSGANLSDSGPFYARFRLFSSQPGFAQFAYSGKTNSGEVEDYAINTASVCPTITDPVSTRVVCSGTPIDTLSVRTTQTNPDSIAFVYFVSAQTNANTIYTSGTGIDTVQVQPANDTVRITGASFPPHSGGASPDTFYVYAILRPLPADPSCRPYAEIRVIVLPVPTATAGTNSPICHGNTIQLTESGGAAVNWSWAGPNGFTSTQQNPVILNASGVHAGNYFVTITDNNSCTNVSPAVSLNVNAPVNAGTAVANDSICLNGSGLSTINLFDKLTGEDAGGTWAVVSGSPGSNFNAGAGTVNPNGLPVDNYVFRYTISGNPPCPNDSEDWTLTIYVCCPPQICLPISVNRN
jgi:uncharacterized repeat protein (TIGR01451 family)